MTANDKNKGAAKPVGQPLRLPRRPGVAASGGLLGSVLARARSVVWHARGVQLCAVPRPGFVDGLDDRLLLDIGLAPAAVRREAPPGPWPL